jgi:hypothetical protein
MIIKVSIKCNTYETKIKEEKTTLKCPNCKAGNLNDHGTYNRWALTIEVDASGCLELRSWRMTIDRVKCISCAKTHAILPGDIIPYKQYTVETYTTILTYVLDNKISVATAGKLTHIPPQIIYGILKQWRALLLRLAMLLRDTFEIHSLPEDTKQLEVTVLRLINENIRRVAEAYLRYFKWPLFMTWNQNANPQKVSVGIAK